MNCIFRNNCNSNTGRHPKLRNILNIIFMVGAIIGVGFYLLADTTIGTIIILIAMSFKIVECSLRLIR